MVLLEIFYIQKQYSSLNELLFLGLVPMNYFRSNIYIIPLSCYIYRHGLYYMHTHFIPLSYGSEQVRSYHVCHGLSIYLFSFLFSEQNILFRVFDVTSLSTHSQIVNLLQNLEGLQMNILIFMKFLLFIDLFVVFYAKFEWLLFCCRPTRSLTVAAITCPLIGQALVPIHVLLS